MSINKSAELTKLCEFSEDQKWQLVYRATEHGFGYDDFHAKCTKKNKCLTIIKSDNGNVFGGYTDASWNKSDRKVADENAFLFSLINRDNNPLKMRCFNPEKAINGNSSSLFMQCYGSELVLYSNSNVNKSSFSNLGLTYKHPTFSYGSSKAKEFLAGGKKFKTLEIEMYVKLR